MTKLEEFGLMLIKQAGHTPETAFWAINPNYSFGVNVYEKATGKSVLHTHASFPQTTDVEVLADAMMQMMTARSTLVIDLDEDITEDNYHEHLDNKYVKQWIADGMPRARDRDNPPMSGVTPDMLVKS